MSNKIYRKVVDTTSRKRLSRYPVLEAEIARQGIMKRDIAESLDITPRALSKKLVGENRFTLLEKTRIAADFFPGFTTDRLFEERGVREDEN